MGNALNILSTQSCNKCKHQLVLKVHTTSKSPELTKELDKQECKNVCLVFMDEGIAEIGSFSTGCEEFERQSVGFTKIKEDVRVRQDLEFL